MNMNESPSYMKSGASVIQHTMISVLLFALTAFGGVAQGQVLLETGFEGATSLPAGWTQNQISGSATWSIQAGGGGSGGNNPATARSGSNNATLYIGNSNENKTRLTSPAFDTVGFTNPSLTFWHTQTLWSPDQDELKVFFSSDGGTNWTELAHYTANVSAWTQRTLNLPTISANSRIAFEGNAKYGYGVCLDDIQVTGIPDTISLVSVSATDASSSEVGPDPGTWTITRIGNTTAALSVNFTMGGTATQGSDYTASLPSPINFAAGETSKVVTLTPIDDAVGAEGNEIATLTLTAGAGYAFGVASGNISIFDDEGYDLNILVIGSTHSFSEGGEHDVVHEKPFNPSTIATHLQQIIDQDPAISGSVNVQFEDTYKTKALSLVHSGSAFSNYTSHCYSLAQHLMWPDEKANRMANLRGQAGTQWDYIIITHDPYIMANFPGMVAEGVKRVKDEVAQSANPAQVLLLAQWPESTSEFTAAQFNEIAFRVGNSAGLTVVPAGKAWDSYSSKDTSSNHPTPQGEYLAAASIYSKIFNRSAKTSVYDFPTVGDAIADHALSAVQANNGIAQYSGTYTSFNPFQMKYLTKRAVQYRETGTSTEDRIAQALGRLDDVHRITFGTAGYAGVPGTRWDFNYGRGGDSWEDDKDYEVNPAIHDWVYGFPMHHNNTTAAPNTMPYGIDKHYSNGTSYEDGTDLGTAYNMIRPNTREPDLPESVRSIPIRLMWLKMAEKSQGFNPLGDNTHMGPYLNDATAAFMYTLISGRCPLVAEPTPQNSSNAAWMQWLGHKIGYETAWQMSHLTTRTPGFQVLPSATAATTVSPTTTEMMTVQFAYPPQADVTVTVSSSSPTTAIVSPKTLVFTPANYNTPQQVKITGIPGATASPTFNVNFGTSSGDEIYHGLTDSWAYTNNRSATFGLTQVDNGSSQITVEQYETKAINLGVAAANAGNTIFAGPHRGSITWQGNGVIQYTPTDNYIGTDQIVFAATNGTTQTIGCIDISVETPDGQVGVSATDASASEEGPDTGTFVISRLGDTGSAVNVLFSPSGTATLGSDYTLSHTSPVIIPPGQSSVTLTVTPVDDSVFGEGNESAILTITADAAYQIGTASATITISDNDNTAPVVDAGQDQTVILSGAAPWLPNSLSLQAWYDASDASTIMSLGGFVSEWRDKTINNRHATQLSVANQPTTASNTMGGRNVITLNGTNQFFNVNLDYLAGATHSAFIVTKTTAFRNIYGAATGNANPGAMSLHVGFSSSTQYRMNFWGNDWNGTIGTAFNASGGNVLNYIWTPTVSKQIFANGTSQGTSANAGAIGTMAGGGRIGNVVGQGLYGGDLAEMVFITGSVDEADRERMEGYLAHKWDLSGNLPLDHPYKDQAPGGEGTTVNLEATITDADGQTPTTLWTKLSGPGAVTFGNANAIDTTASFTVAGTYTLRLIANDGVSEVSDDIVVTVSNLTPYQIWTGGTFTNNFTDTALTSNPDGDNLTNLQEFAFGTDPTSSVIAPLTYVPNGTTNPGIPILENAGTTQSPSYRAVFARRKDHGIASISYEVQFSANLEYWKASSSGLTILSGISSASVEAVSIPYPTTVPLSSAETEHAAPKFFRVAVWEN